MLFQFKHLFISSYLLDICWLSQRHPHSDAPSCSPSPTLRPLLGHPSSGLVRANRTDMDGSQKPRTHSWPSPPYERISRPRQLYHLILRPSITRPSPTYVVLLQSPTKPMPVRSGLPQPCPQSKQNHAFPPTTLPCLLKTPQQDLRPSENNPPPHAPPAASPCTMLTLSSLLQPHWLFLPSPVVTPFSPTTRFYTCSSLCLKYRPLSHS